MTDKVTAGYIPLVDAVGLLVAADFGFAEQEGLKIELIREVSWANIREKLNTGLLDTAHLLAPMAIASTLNLMPGSVPLAAPFILATNGNAITVGNTLWQEIESELHGEAPHPLATATALARIAARRKSRSLPNLTFGCTFPFSCHSYLLQVWMAAGGLDAACDTRLIVLPPPHMVDSLKCGEVDGFCVGEPWSSLAVELGLGQILHFGAEIVNRLTEKVLAARVDWLDANAERMIRLMSAISAAAEFAKAPEHWDLICEKLAAPDRLNVKADLTKRALCGSLKTGPGGGMREDRNFLQLGTGFWGRPDKTQAAWLYAQMLRWGQTDAKTEDIARVEAVFSADLFDRAFGPIEADAIPHPGSKDNVGCFAGLLFDKL
jgi:NitT/TauT family transport system ATP-binding protein